MRVLETTYRICKIILRLRTVYNSQPRHPFSLSKMGLGCTTPNSCHPFLLVFGLIYVALFVALILVPTLFDRADLKRQKRSSKLASLESKKKVRDTESDPGTSFRAVRYEDTAVTNDKQGSIYTVC